jgi:predicted transcriptional regulator
MVFDKLELKVEDYMTPNPISVKSTLKLKDAITIMAKKKIGNSMSLRPRLKILDYLIDNIASTQIPCHDACH